MVKLSNPPELENKELAEYLKAISDAIAELQAGGGYVREERLLSAEAVDFYNALTDVNAPATYRLEIHETGSFAISTTPAPVGSIIDSVEILGSNPAAGIQSCTCYLRETALWGEPITEVTEYDSLAAPSGASEEWSVTLRPARELKVRSDRKLFAIFVGGGAGAFHVNTVRWIYWRPLFPTR
jgi:hypothetical protein